MRLALKTGLIFILIILSLPAWASVSIFSGRMSYQDNRTRFVFDMNKSTRYQVFTLKNPARIVVDLEDAKLKFSPKSIEPAGDIKRIRFAKKGKNGVRVVFDVKKTLRYYTFYLPPHSKNKNYRLVVDLKPSKATKKTVIKPKPVKKIKSKAVKKPEGRDVIVAIDAGHGGKDSGAIGRNGVYEKNITLAVAKKLAADIDRQPGMRAVLTRKSNVFLTLRQRTEIARKAKADLFVSLHADSFNGYKATGASVYILSLMGASSEAARLLANRENSADLANGVEISNRTHSLARVLIDLSQTFSVKSSEQLAQAVLQQLGKTTKLHKKTAQKARFIVLKSPDIPSILIEMGFISNYKEAERLSTTSYQKKIAEKIFLGIKQYLVHRAPSDTKIALHGFPKYKTYRVRFGDSLGGIAIKQGVSINTLKSVNRLKGSKILVGQRLKIPLS